MRRWTKGKGWSVSLKPPKGSGAVGISGHRLAVTDNGATVFCLGELLWQVRGWLGVAAAAGSTVQECT